MTDLAGGSGVDRPGFAVGQRHRPSAAIWRGVTRPGRGCGPGG